MDFSIFQTKTYPEHKLYFNQFQIGYTIIDDEHWYKKYDIETVLNCMHTQRALTVTGRKNVKAWHLKTKGGRQKTYMLNFEGVQNLVNWRRLEIGNELVRFLKENMHTGNNRENGYRDDSIVPDELITMSFEKMPIRIVMHNGRAWFIAKDLENVTGTHNIRRILDRGEKNDQAFFLIETGDKIKTKRSFLGLSKFAACSMVLRTRISNIPAQRLAAWLIDIVLPNLEKPAAKSTSAAAEKPEKKESFYQGKQRCMYEKRIGDEDFIVVMEYFKKTEFAQCKK